MRSKPPRTLAITTALGGGLALAIAFVTEVWGGIVPCALCLVERWPYRLVIILGLLALFARRGLARLLLVMAVLCLLADAAVAAVHVGVEFGWWPSPLPECAAPSLSTGSLADRLASMPDHPAKPCDDATYLIPGLPLSMAAMNLIYALLFATLIALSLRERPRWR